LKRRQYHKKAKAQLTLATVGNAAYKNPLTTSLTSTVGDGDIRKLPGNFFAAVGVTHRSPPPISMTKTTLF
jgi:hypothetical protein